MTNERRAAGTGEARGAGWDLAFEQATGGTLLVRLSGRWRLDEKLPSPDEVRRQVESNPAVRRMAFDTAGITGRDSSLLTFLGKVFAENDGRQIETDRAGLPEGVRRLLALAAAVPERKDTQTAGAGPSWLASLDFHVRKWC